MARRTSRSSVYNNRAQSQVNNAVGSSSKPGVRLPVAYAQSAPNPTSNRSQPSNSQQSNPWDRASQFAQNVGRGASDTVRSYTTDPYNQVSAYSRGETIEEREYEDESLGTVFGRGLFEGDLDGAWDEAGRRVTEEPGRVVGEVATEAAIMAASMGFGAAVKGGRIGYMATSKLPKIAKNIKRTRGATKADGPVGFIRKTGLIRKGTEEKYIGNKRTTVITKNRKGVEKRRVKRTNILDRLERFGTKHGERFGNTLGRQTRIDNPMIMGASGLNIAGKGSKINTEKAGYNLGSQSTKMYDNWAGKNQDTIGTKVTEWSKPITQTFNEGASESTGSVQGIDNIKKVVFLSDDGINEPRNIKELDALKANTPVEDWDTKKLFSKQTDEDLKSGRGVRKGLQSYFDKRISQNEFIPETGVSGQNVKRVAGDFDGSPREELIDGSTYDSMFGASPIAEDITKETVKKKINLSLLKSEGEGMDMSLHGDASKEAQKMIDVYSMQVFKQTVSTGAQAERLKLKSAKSIKIQEQEAALNLQPFYPRTKKRVNSMGKQVKPDEEGINMYSGADTTFSPQRIGTDPIDEGLSKQNALKSRTTNPIGHRYIFQGKPKKGDPSFSSGKEFEEFSLNLYSKEGRAESAMFDFPASMIVPGDETYAFASATGKKRISRIDDNQIDSLRAVRERFRFWKGKEYRDKSDTSGGSTPSNTVGKNPDKDYFDIDEYRENVEGLPSESVEIGAKFDKKFANRKDVMNRSDFQRAYTEQKTPGFEIISQDPESARLIGQRDYKEVQRSRNLSPEAFLKETNQSKEQFNQSTTFITDRNFDAVRLVTGDIRPVSAGGKPSEYTLLNRFNKVKKVYNSQTMGGKGSGVMDWGDTTVSWVGKPVRGGKTRVKKTTLGQNNPIFGQEDPAKRSRLIKKALAKRKKDLKAEDALRAKRKKQAEKAVAQKKPRGKSKARSGGTFGDAFKDIYDNQGPRGQFDSLDNDLDTYEYYRID